MANYCQALALQPWALPIWQLGWGTAGITDKRKKLVGSGHTHLAQLVDIVASGGQPHHLQAQIHTAQSSDHKLLSALSSQAGLALP